MNMVEMTNHDRDIAVGNAMIKYGGGFVRALGNALIRADTYNTQVIKDAFPEYFEKYSELADAERSW